MTEGEELQLFTLSEARGMQLFTIEVPANIGKILMDLTVFYALNHSEYIKDIVYQTVDRELQAGGGIDSGLAAFLKKKYKYTPRTAGTQRKVRRRRQVNESHSG